MKRIYYAVVWSIFGYVARYLVWLLQNARTLFSGNYFILVGTPQHGNLGDQAIALAEYQLFAECDKEKAIIEIPSVIMYKAKWFKKWIGNRPIFIHGGGFIGTLWFNEEEMLRGVIKNYPNNKIVILPQTITFEDTEWGNQVKQESIEIYNAHKDLIICAREMTSYEMGKQLFPNARVLSVPDMVLGYRTEISHCKERRGVITCLRCDCEKALSESDNEQIFSILKVHFGNEIEHTDTVIDKIIDREERNEVVGHKLEQFASAKLIVTDRLHGMVFAMLAGTPCIALGNTNGKVKGIYQWIRECQYVKYVEKIDDIAQIVPQILEKKNCYYSNLDILEKYTELKKIISCI